MASRNIMAFINRIAEMLLYQFFFKLLKRFALCLRNTFEYKQISCEAYYCIQPECSACSESFV